MSQPPRLLTDREFAALTTDEKFNYLNEIVSCLLNYRAKTAEQAPATPAEAPPAEPQSGQDATKLP